MNIGVGELAALMTACMWAGSAMFFSRASQAIGSFLVTQIRLPFAVVVLLLVVLASSGSSSLTGISIRSLWLLSASGLIGLTFGDITLFRSYLYLGPRRTSLVMSTTPIWAALLGAMLLDEPVSQRVWFGMLITLAGIWLALSSRTQTRSKLIDKKWVGVLLALMGAWGQALGLVLAKEGMGDISPIVATLVRMVAALLGGVFIISVTRSWKKTAKAFQHKRGMKFTLLGTVVGPVVGVSLSLYAIQNASVALSACLMAMAPIVIIPLAIKFDGEKIGLMGVVGTLVAFSGVVVLLT